MTQENQLSTIPTRLDRIRTWHKITSQRASETRLLIFFAGMEIQGLKSALGITERQRTDIDGTAERVSAVSGGQAKTWQDLLELKTGMTARTARNYVAFYEMVVYSAPEFAHWVLEHAAPRIDDDSEKFLALPDPHTVIANIDPSALQKFQEATDPYSLSQLYQRPLKPAEVAALTDKSKKKAEEKDQAQQLTFWFGEVATKIKSKEYLRFGLRHRVMLLDELELAVRELKASLKGAGQ